MGYKRHWRHFFKRGELEANQPGPYESLACFTIIALAFILYGNTIFHDYAHDDSVVITNNVFTQQGISGIWYLLSNDTFFGRYGVKKMASGKRYRPLSLITFAIEYEFFGLNPHISHFVNVSLYALTGILIWLILSKLLIDYPSAKWYFSVPFLTAVFFIMHPIHTDVIANIKGRDEILSLLLSLVTLSFTFRYIGRKRTKYLIYSSIYFFLALLSKENTLTFIAVIPLTVYFFRTCEAKRKVVSIIPLIFSAALYLIIRQALIADMPKAAPNLINNPFLEASLAQKYATISYTLGIYVKLLFFPHPLTYDYYPYHIPIINWLDPRAIIPLIFYLTASIYALAGLKKKHILSYGILYFLITISITSNLAQNIGAFMAERFAYMPSLGFCLIIGYLISQVLPKYIKNEKHAPTAIASIIFIILSLSSAKTIARNEAWKDDFTLFTTDVETSTNSIKSNHDAANVLIKKGERLRGGERNRHFELAIGYLNKAHEIDPRNQAVLLLLGNAHFKHKQEYDKVIYYYETLLRQDPDNHMVHYNISKIFNRYNNVNFKIRLYKDLYNIHPERYETNYILGMLLLGKKVELDTALFHLEKAIQLDPNSPGIQEDIDHKEIGKIFDKDVKRPGNEEIYLLLGTAFHESGDHEKAKECFDKADKLSDD